MTPFFFVIVLLIHKIHFSNQITVLRPNDITETFFFCRGQDKQNRAPTEVKDNIWYKNKNIWYLVTVMSFLFGFRVLFGYVFLICVT